MTVIGRDEYGNIVDAEPVMTYSFTPAIPGDGYAEVTTYAGPGFTDLGIMIPVSGTYFLTAELDSSTYTCDEFEGCSYFVGEGTSFYVMATDASAPHCLVTGNGLSSAVAGEEAVFELYLYDVESNPVESDEYDTIDDAYLNATINGEEVIVPLSLTWSSANPPHYQVSYTPTISNEEFQDSGGDFQVVIIVNGVAMTIADTPVVFASTEHETYSEAVEIESEASAGVEYTFEIHAKDMYGNARQDPNDVLVFTVTGTTSDGTPLGTGRVSSKEKGVYYGHITSTLAHENMTITVLLDGVEIGVNGVFSVPVVPGLPSEMSILDVSTLTEGNAGVSNTLQFTSIDGYGNIRTNEDDRTLFTQQIQRVGGYAVEDLSIECVPSCPTATGEYSIDWLVNTASNYTITIVTDGSLGGLTIVNANEARVLIIPGETSDASVQGTGIEGGVKGETNEFELIAEDQFGNVQFHHNDSFEIDVYFVDDAETVTVTAVAGSTPGHYTVSYDIDSDESGTDFTLTVYLIDGTTRIELSTYNLAMVQSGDVSFALACSSHADAIGITDCDSIAQTQAGIEQVFYIVNVGNDLVLRSLSTRFSVYFLEQGSADSINTWAAEVCACDLGTNGIPCEDEVISSGGDCEATGSTDYFSVRFTPDRVGNFSVSVAEKGVIITDQSPIWFTGNIIEYIYIYIYI